MGPGLRLLIVLERGAEVVNRIYLIVEDGGDSVTGIASRRLSSQRIDAWEAFFLLFGGLLFIVVARLLVHDQLLL